MEEFWNEVIEYSTYTDASGIGIDERYIKLGDLKDILLQYDLLHEE